MDIGLINAGLLFAIAVPVVMQYRILPIEGTPYWLFGILFFLLVSNVCIAIFKKNWVKAQTVILWLVLFITVGGATYTGIVDRSKTAPIYGVHDIILQQEAAMRYLLSGINPYKATYFGTPVEGFGYEELGRHATNPALYHFVMPPWYLIFPFSFYAITIPVWGFFDGRIPLLILLFGLLFILSRWFKSRGLAATAIMLTALSPAVINYFIEGRSDLFALFWFVWALFLLEKKKFWLSAPVFALALLSKQTIWFAFPFYAVYFWKTTAHTFRERVLPIVLFIIPLIVLVGPFLAWDYKAFFDSVVFYLSGNTANAYPVSGYGLSMVLYDAGIIKDIHAYYPFMLWEAPLGLGVLFVTLVLLWKKLKMSYLLLFYGLTLFVVWYTSRYFNNSHVSYLSSIFVLALLKFQDESLHEKQHG